MGLSIPTSDWPPIRHSGTAGTSCTNAIPPCGPKASRSGSTRREAKGRSPFGRGPRQALAERRCQPAHVELPLGRHDPDLQLAAAAAFSDDQVAQARAAVGARRGALRARRLPCAGWAPAGAGADCVCSVAVRSIRAALVATPIPRLQALRAAPAQGQLARPVAALGGEQAVAQPGREPTAAYLDAIVRAQDNYVVQLADPNAEKPELARKIKTGKRTLPPEFDRPLDAKIPFTRLPDGDAYAPEVGFSNGFPVASDPKTGRMWLTHCYGMLGAGRDPLARRGQHLHCAGVRVRAFALVHHGAHAVARDRAGHEHHVTPLSQPGDALAAKRKRLDLQLELIAWARARRARVGARARAFGRRVARPLGRRLLGHGLRRLAHDALTSSSSSAFWAWRRFSA